jgi:hypothetical protein
LKKTQDVRVAAARLLDERVARKKLLHVSGGVEVRLVQVDSGEADSAIIAQRSNAQARAEASKMGLVVRKRYGFLIQRPAPVP